MGSRTVTIGASAFGSVSVQYLSAVIARRDAAEHDPEWIALDQLGVELAHVGRFDRAGARHAVGMFLSWKEPRDRRITILRARLALKLGLGALDEEREQQLGIEPRQLRQESRDQRAGE